MHLFMGWLFVLFDLVWFLRLGWMNEWMDLMDGSVDFYVVG